MIRDSVDPKTRRKMAMDSIRAGRTVEIDLDYINEVVEIHAEMGDVLYTFFVTREDGSTDEIAGMVVRKLLIEYEFRIVETGE
jgi:hypothetical protein